MGLLFEVLLFMHVDEESLENVVDDAKARNEETK